MSQQASIEDIQKWMLIRLRQALRGQKVRSNIERWLNGEFGKNHEFPVMSFGANLGDEAIRFVQDPRNRAALDSEWIRDPS